MLTRRSVIRLLGVVGSVAAVPKLPGRTVDSAAVKSVESRRLEITEMWDKKAAAWRTVGVATTYLCADCGHEAKVDYHREEDVIPAGEVTLCVECMEKWVRSLGFQPGTIVPGTFGIFKLPKRDGQPVAFFKG